MNKIVKRLLIIFMPVLVIGFVFTHFNYYYIIVSNLKLAMDDMRKNENYDVAIIGPSTAYSGFIPCIIDKELKVNSINLGTGAQLACDSYFITKEYIEYNKPRFIIFNIEPEYFFGENRYISTKSDTTINTLGTVKPSIDKLKFELRMLLERPQVALDFLTYHITFDGFSKAGYDKKYNLAELEKLNEDVLSVGSKGAMIYKGFQNAGSLGKIEFKADHRKKVKIGFKYLYEIISLCKDNNIELFLITQGSTDARVLARKNWGYMHDEFAKIAHENNLIYWDFVYAKPELWDRGITNWAEDGNVSITGAQGLSKAVSKLINMKNEDVSKYFYKSYSDYLETVDIANLWLEKTQDGLKANCTYGMDGIPMYKFYGRKRVSKNEGNHDAKEEWVLVKDYSENAFLNKDYYEGIYTDIKVYGKLDRGSIERYAAFEVE